jgi:hypothetical protein
MRFAVLFVAACLITSVALAQGQAQPEQKKPAYVSPSARLAAAKKVYLKNTGGSDVPYNVFQSALEGWARYRLVDSAEEADIVIDITSPDDDRSNAEKTRVASSSSGKSRAPDLAVNRANTEGPIRVVVFDARTHLTLWSATDQPKGGFRQKARDEHLVEAAQRLVTKFRERVEPEKKQ